MISFEEYYAAIMEPDGGPVALAYFQQKINEYCPSEPSALNPQEIALIEKIREAFKNVRLEDGIGLLQAEAEDDYACAEVQAFLAQHEEREDWAKLTAAHLNTCSSALSYVDAKGFRFLLPAFIIHEMMNQLDSADPHFSLTYDLHPDPVFAASFPTYDAKQLIIGKCALLSDHQKSVLQEYIRYYRTRGPQYNYSVSLWDTPEEITRLEQDQMISATNYLQDIPVSKNWLRHRFLMSRSREELVGHALDSEENSWLVRIYPGIFTEYPEADIQEKLSHKLEEIRICRELAQAGIPVSAPVETGEYRNTNRIYILQPWITGTQLKDLSRLESNTPAHRYYELGLEAGKILKAIHSAPVLPAHTESGDQILQKEFEQILNGTPPERKPSNKEKQALRYVESHISLMRRSPTVFLHGNYTTEHIILKKDGTLAIIDFKSWKKGDAARDFCALMLQLPFFSDKDLAKSINFARGQIDGYCDHKPTDEFFKSIAIHTAFHLYSDIYSPPSPFSPYKDTTWTDFTYPKGFESHIPSWYSGKIY